MRNKKIISKIGIVGTEDEYYLYVMNHQDNIEYKEFVHVKYVKDIRGLTGMFFGASCYTSPFYIELSNYLLGIPNIAPFNLSTERQKDLFNNL